MDGPGTSSELRFKVASEGWEFEQIHELNYRTFVDEIPQHEANEARVLCDKFHEQNTYLIAVRGKRVVAMVAVRDRRPFSLDQKLGDVGRYLPVTGRCCEIRLLAAERTNRHSRVLAGLIEELVGYCREREYEMALISGTVRELRLYRHLGFVAFGPMVGKAGAMYQPMYLTRRSFEERGHRFMGEKKG